MVGNYVGGFYHAFLYSNGVFTNLGSLFDPSSATFASDINDNGQILGRFTLSNGLVHAFLYEDGSVYDLNNYVSGLPPNWTIGSATFYQGTSDILAQAYDGQRSTTFLLTVPEPGGALLLSCFPFVLMNRRRRDNRGD